MSLTAGRRYLLADGVERWSAKQAAPIVEALADLPPDRPWCSPPARRRRSCARRRAWPRRSPPGGGEVLDFQAPKARQLPAWLVAEAERRQITLEPDAARLLVERMGSSTVRLSNELDRLAIWAGPGGTVEREDLEAMIADTSEEAVWAPRRRARGAQPLGGADARPSASRRRARR